MCLTLLCTSFPNRNNALPPLPAAQGGFSSYPAKVQGDLAPAPWEDGSAKAVALAPIPPAAAPTIDEMLEMMARQVMDVVNWTKAEGFGEAYREASRNTRGLFQAAAFQLSARADQLRKG